MYAGKAILTAKEWISSRTLILKFELEEALSFVPGQFFTFFFEREGKKNPRSYSVLELNGKELVLCIKLVDGGLASVEFEKAEIGQEFSIRGPFGKFIYQQDNNPNVMFIATDTGIVPFHAMIRNGEVLKKNTILLFGCRNQEEIYFNEYYQTLAKNNNNFTFLPTLTREEWDGLTGRVQNHLPQWTQLTSYYVCGRKEMVKEVVEILKSRGVKDQDIKIERYD